MYIYRIHNTWHLAAEQEQQVQQRGHLRHGRDHRQRERVQPQHGQGETQSVQVCSCFNLRFTVMLLQR